MCHQHSRSRQGTRKLELEAGRTPLFLFFDLAFIFELALGMALDGNVQYRNLS